MKTSKILPFLRRPAAMAASLALFICVAGTTVLAGTGGLRGFFGDILGHNGAVVGTSYSQATDEVALTVTQTADGITAEMTMVYPDQVPYRELETLGIEAYSIVDGNGTVILEGTAPEPAPIAAGKASVTISTAGLPQGTYKLIIHELTGSKKADQPLILGGNWECAFTR